MQSDDMNHLCLPLKPLVNENIIRATAVIAETSIRASNPWQKSGNTLYKGSSKIQNGLLLKKWQPDVI